MPEQLPARFEILDPEEKQPKPTGTVPLQIVARVWTPSGKPVAGARVELLQTPVGVEVGPEASAVEAQYRAFRNHAAVPVREDAEITDPEGLATLEVPSVEGSLHLRALHPDFDRAIRTLELDPVPGGTYDLFLRDGATVEAWIYGELPSTGSEDSSDASARVVYLYQGSEGRPRARRQATIEEVETGRYRALLRGLPAGTWEGQVTVLVQIRGGRGWKTLARAPHPVTLSPGGHARLDFVVTEVKCSP